MQTIDVRSDGSLGKAVRGEPRRRPVLRLCTPSLWKMMLTDARPGARDALPASEAPVRPSAVSQS